MTRRLETVTAIVGELMQTDLERQQRASAPTLRDLLVAIEQPSAKPSADEASSGPADNNSGMDILSCCRRSYQ